MKKTRASRGLKRKVKEEQVESRDGDGEKELLEIRKLKNQRLIAILTAAVSLLTAIISNYSELKTLLQPDPMVRLNVKDEFVRRYGYIRITKLDVAEELDVVMTTVSAALNWLPLYADSYHLRIVVGDDEYYSTHILLKKGDKRTIMIPQKEMGRIRIMAKDLDDRPLPVSPLELTVETSGNGYLWIFERRDAISRLIYPDSISANEIRVEAPFVFPRPHGHKTIYVGDKPGEERLLLVVTSTRDLSLAEEIGKRLTSEVILKASLKERTENWGAKEVSYWVSTSR